MDSDEALFQPLARPGHVGDIDYDKDCQICFEPFISGHFFDIRHPTRVKIETLCCRQSICGVCVADLKKSRGACPFCRKGQKKSSSSRQQGADGTTGAADDDAAPANQTPTAAADGALPAAAAAAVAAVAPTPPLPAQPSPASSSGLLSQPGMNAPIGGYAPVATYASALANGLNGLGSSAAAPAPPPSGIGSGIGGGNGGGLLDDNAALRAYIFQVTEQEGRQMETTIPAAIAQRVSEMSGFGPYAPTSEPSAPSAPSPAPTPAAAAAAASSSVDALFRPSSSPYGRVDLESSPLQSSPEDSRRDWLLGGGTAMTTVPSASPGSSSTSSALPGVASSFMPSPSAMAAGSAAGGEIGVGGVVQRMMQQWGLSEADLEQYLSIGMQTVMSNQQQQAAAAPSQAMPPGLQAFLDIAQPSSHGHDHGHGQQEPSRSSSDPPFFDTIGHPHQGVDLGHHSSDALLGGDVGEYGGGAAAAAAAAAASSASGYGGLHNGYGGGWDGGLEGDDEEEFDESQIPEPPPIFEDDEFQSTQPPESVPGPSTVSAPLPPTLPIPAKPADPVPTSTPPIAIAASASGASSSDSLKQPKDTSFPPPRILTPPSVAVGSRANWGSPHEPSTTVSAKTADRPAASAGGKPTIIGRGVGESGKKGKGQQGGQQGGGAKDKGAVEEKEKEKSKEKDKDGKKAVKRSASDVIPEKKKPQQPDEKKSVLEKPTIPERRPKKEPARPKTTLSDLRNDPMRNTFAHIAESDTESEQEQDDTSKEEEATPEPAVAETAPEAAATGKKKKKDKKKQKDKAASETLPSEDPAAVPAKTSSSPALTLEPIAEEGKDARKGKKKPPTPTANGTATDKTGRGATGVSSTAASTPNGTDATAGGGLRDGEGGGGSGDVAASRMDSSAFKTLCVRAAETKKRGDGFWQINSIRDAVAKWEAALKLLESLPCASLPPPKDTDELAKAAAAPINGVVDLTAFNKTVSDLFIACNSNCAEGYNRLKDWKRAEEKSSVVLGVVDDNIKALFRRAVAREQLGNDYFGGRDDIEKAIAMWEEKGVDTEQKREAIDLRSRLDIQCELCGGGKGGKSADKGPKASRKK
ncbi:unnamed protein product [Vitrella brassicaformis CCMP3155]|uniref:RING-type domain-containing protein n=3 Tax=Vitrella brassicaformis TaxID=1169539 RepID=A0A0G4EES8_VITBC|nr:unnamed protein product [Vitrella brassicaformis CCMP3155]|eukprot:CEL93883.1 unnamed protein product [Vitrella brassicaformis CCMP3155]